MTPPTSDAVSSAPVPEPVVESSTSGPTTSPPQGDPPSGMNALDRYMTDVYHLEVPSLHYVDIDGQAISATPNRNHEFLYYSGWLQTSSPISDQGTAFVEMGVINDSDVPQCAARSQRQEGILHFGMMQTTQSVCVRTSEGRWALVQVESADEQLGGGVLLHIGYLRDQ